MTLGDTTQGTPPSLIYLARRALRFWKEAGLLMLLAMVATLIIAKLTAQPYRSEAVLMYDHTVPSDLASLDPNQAGARIKDLLFATERVRAVVEEFQLHPELTIPQGIEEARKRLQFTLQPGNTFSIAFTGSSPAEAQSVLQRLSETLIRDHNRHRTEAVTETRRFFDTERKEIDEEVKRKELALKEFLGMHPEVASLNEADPLSEDPAVMLLEQELARTRVQARAQSTSGRGGLPGASRSLTDLENLKKQSEALLDKARQDLQDTLDTKTEAHPDVVVARDRVRRAEGDVVRYRAQMEARATELGTPKGEHDDLARTIKEMEGRIVRMRATARDRTRRSRDPKMLQLEVQLQRLRHELGEARERLSRLEDRQVHASVLEKMAGSGELLRLKVLDPPSLPGSPVQNRRRRAALVGFMVTCLLGAGYALGRALTSDRIFERADLAQLASANVLVVIPQVPARLRRARV
jgi:uncharacterized protein involved in exopolysaccharide biosynthesis